MSIENAVKEYLTRPDKTVPQIIKDNHVGTQTLYDHLHKRARHARQGGGFTFRRDWVKVKDRAIAAQYLSGTPIREIKTALGVGAGRIYRIVALLGLKPRR